jgi:hypothetical protein
MAVVTSGAKDEENCGLWDSIANKPWVMAGTANDYSNGGSWPQRPKTRLTADRGRPWTSPAAKHGQREANDRSWLGREAAQDFRLEAAPVFAKSLQG